uniref:proline-rich protein 5-like isoform X2 n=1 Tax=Scatophagus argus TaxID=75038 RepID=UPI001ED80F83|nr:proline-rich protein 5-like isoform X2 [Scatophagus argus]
MMGSFRRPRPRFMSSPVLSDLARFHASSPALQISNTSVWNSVQSAVIKVFQGGALQSNELYTLNESIRWLLKTEMGSFITDYFQNQLLTRGLSEVLDQVLLHSGDKQLAVLADMWDRFFTEILPTLQAIFYPVQGQELTVRQMALLAFRDLVLLKLHLEETLGTAASIPPAVTQMLLVLQGIHESGGPSVEYYRLERLVEVVVSPYLSNVLQNRNQLLLDDPTLPSLVRGVLHLVCRCSRWCRTCSAAIRRIPPSAHVRLVARRPVPAGNHRHSASQLVRLVVSGPTGGAGGRGVPGEVWRRAAAHGGQRTL